MTVTSPSQNLHAAGRYCRIRHLHRGCARPRRGGHRDHRDRQQHHRRLGDHGGVDHALETYAIQWTVISTAAAKAPPRSTTPSGGHRSRLMTHVPMGIRPGRATRRAAGRPQPRVTDTVGRLRQRLAAQACASNPRSDLSGHGKRGNARAPAAAGSPSIAPVDRVSEMRIGVSNAWSGRTGPVRRPKRRMLCPARPARGSRPRG
jgi:hypothetical protein